MFLEPDAKPEVRWFPPLGRGRYLADPFGIVKGGQVHILCEEFDYRSYKGVITRIRLSEDSRAASRRVAIDMPFHMSYPYLVEWKGDVYCVPEMHEAREIGLFKANEFPDSWSKVGTLASNFAGIDPTIVLFQGRWWMQVVNFLQIATVLSWLYASTTTISSIHLADSRHSSMFLSSLYTTIAHEIVSRMVT